MPVTSASRRPRSASASPAAAPRAGSAPTPRSNAARAATSSGSGVTPPASVAGASRRRPRRVGPPSLTGWWSPVVSGDERHGDRAEHQRDPEEQADGEHHGRGDRADPDADDEDSDQ